MEENYEISSMEFSLKSICAVRVMHQVLLASGVKHNRTPTYRPFALDIDPVDIIFKLELPLHLINMLRDLSDPFQKELGGWYAELHKYLHGAQIKCDPVLTLQGTVDMVRSVKDVLAKEPMDKRDRYRLACDYCFEEQISEMFIELKLQEVDLMNPDVYYRSMLQSSTFVMFWTRAFQGKFGFLIDGKYLPIQVYGEGFKISLILQRDTAIKHFIEKAPIKTVRSCIYINEYYYLRRYRSYFWDNISPSTYCLLFSKLNKDQQQELMNLFADVLLKSLAKWPYLVFFTKAILSFAHLPHPSNYRTVMDNAITNTYFNADWETGGYNYRELCVTLWKLRSLHKLSTSDFDKLVCGILKRDDRRLIIMIFSEMTTNEKYGLLMRFQANKVLDIFINKNDHAMFKWFIKTCSMNSRKVLLKFKSKFLTWNPSCAAFESRLSYFMETVYKIVDEKRNADALDQ